MSKETVMLNMSNNGSVVHVTTSSEVESSRIEELINKPHVPFYINVNTPKSPEEIEGERLIVAKKYRENIQHNAFHKKCDSVGKIMMICVLFLSAYITMLGWSLPKGNEGFSYYSSGVFLGVITISIFSLTNNLKLIEKEGHQFYVEYPRDHLFPYLMAVPLIIAIFTLLSFFNR